MAQEMYGTVGDHGRGDGSELVWLNREEQKGSAKG